MQLKVKQFDNLFMQNALEALANIKVMRLLNCEWKKVDNIILNYTTVKIYDAEIMVFM